MESSRRTPPTGTQSNTLVTAKAKAKVFSNDALDFETESSF